MPQQVMCRCGKPVEPSRVVSGARKCKKCASRETIRSRRIRMSQEEFDAFIKNGRGVVSGEVMR